MNRVQKDIISIIEDRKLFEALKKSTIFVTGATGLIGSMIMKTLYAANKKYFLDINIVGQIRNCEKARQMFNHLYNEMEFVKDFNVPCDHIIHTISPTTSKFFIEHPVETIKSSVESTIEILEIAKKYRATLVYLSSMEQYGVPYICGEHMAEDKVGIIDHLNIRSSYSESKRLCECLCASYVSEYSINVKIARLAQTFGAGVAPKDNRMPIQFARALIEGRDIVLHTEGRSFLNFVYLTDAVVGILTILKKGENGQAYNVCNDKETRSVRECAELIADRISSRRINVKVDVQEKNMGYAPDVVMYLDSRKLNNLGWNARVSMLEGYKRLVEYLEETKFEK